VHLVGFIIRIYHDARSFECQKIQLATTCNKNEQHDAKNNAELCMVQMGEDDLEVQ